MPARQPVMPETPDTAAPETPEATGTPAPEATATTGRTRRAKREGPRAEVEFIISVRNALKAGVDTESVLDVLNFAVRANGLAAWRMVTETMGDLIEDAKDAQAAETESE